MNSFVIPFKDINLSNLPEVGGKNASLGEMFNKLHSFGIEVPDGFAISVESYRNFLSENKLTDRLKEILESIDNKSLSNLSEVGEKCRGLISNGILSDTLKDEIGKAYRELGGNQNDLAVAVRSSAT